MPGSEKNLSKIELKTYLIVFGEKKSVQYGLNMVCVE